MVYNLNYYRSLLLNAAKLSLSTSPYPSRSIVHKNDVIEPIHLVRINEFGQPTSSTHPHVLKQDEVIPHVKSIEFSDRRNRLLQNIEKYETLKGSGRIRHVVIIPASCKKYMTEKIPFIYRQDSDMAYLSGCLEPDSVLLLTAISGHYESTLFVRGKDVQAELWDGPRTGIDQVQQMFGIDRGLPWSEFSSYLRCLLTPPSSNLIVWYDYLTNVHPEVTLAIKENLPSDGACESPKSFIHQLRLLKSPAEQLLMKQTCEIGSEAILRTIKASQRELHVKLHEYEKPVVHESSLWAKVDYECRILGAQHLAYPPVVAGGSRANIIHYINNNNVIQNGELVLMDAGCEYHGYSSDITRTWPISGKFTPIQRSLYEMLLSVQMELINKCSERPTLNQLFQIMCQLLGRGLKELGVLSPSYSSDEDISKAAYTFCPHHVGHYLGMDVHDTSSVPRNLPLQPGMVITIEPGVYIGYNNNFANPLYRGIGLRIEDDVLITENGPVVLTEHCPKHPDDLEDLTQL